MHHIFLLSLVWVFSVIAIEYSLIRAPLPTSPKWIAGEEIWFIDPKIYFLKYCPETKNRYAIDLSNTTYINANKSIHNHVTFHINFRPIPVDYG